MKEIHKMRLGVLRELKQMHRFLDNMERSVKTLNPDAIQKAYMFLVHLVSEMDEGCLRPDAIALDVALAQALRSRLEEDEK